MRKLIGNKEFYKRVLAISLPIMLQNGISNFVSMLDNIMVGRVGTEQMSGVSIVNQLIFIFYLCIFGAISGAGIFTAQFYGQKNMKGVRDTLRFKLIICLVITAIAVTVMVVFQNPLISLYLHDGSATGDLAATLRYGKDYLWIMMIGLVPFAVEQSYSSTLRETGETVVPMRASIIAVFVNLVLNYILIYGKFGMPVLGVQGAAVATVIARFVQVAIVIAWAHTAHKVKDAELLSLGAAAPSSVEASLTSGAATPATSEAVLSGAVVKRKLPYIEGTYESLRVPWELVRKIAIMGLPLLINEGLWAAGIATQTQCYSNRGLSVIAALNISSTITNVFNIVFIALGDAVAIIVGQQLGSGEHEKARDTAYKIITFSVSTCVVIGSILFFVGPFFPDIYNTSVEVRDLAGNFIRCAAVCMPLHGYLHSTYFTLRSGGKTIITFLFDSFFLWVVAVPLAYVLTHFTALNIVWIYLFCLLIEGIKVIIGTILLRSGVWMNTIVDDV
ncbi:MAG: polysaccharide biosynthesis C-terminal domain-containing protein [Lachnospiraceae bacterium]|nr:polysaccharide biosynthesis C-terminal domain-containing protein [Lachnospiraceae bacterium]